MKAKLTLCVLFLHVLAGLNPARAQNTAFTYQGRLNFNGAPVSGNYDFQFAVFDASAAGKLIAGPISVSSVTVSVGLFVTRLDFGPGVFTGPGRWLQISFRPTGNGNFTPMDQRLELTSSPYAIRAQAAGMADTLAAGAVVKSLNGLHDDVTLAAGANVTLTPNGNTITLSAVGGGGGGVWSVNANNAYYTAGNVGIGTSTPGSLLDLQGSQDAFHITGYEPFMTFFDANHNNAHSSVQSVNGGLNFFTDAYLKGSNLFGFMLLAPNGNVGIGSSQPVGKLEVVAQDALRMIGYQPFLTFYDSNAGYAAGRIQSVGGGVGQFTDAYVKGSDLFGFMMLAPNGNVGIGSSQPVGKLEVAAQDALRMIGYQPFLTFYDSNAGYAAGRIQSVGGGVGEYTDAYIKGSDSAGYILLHPSGNVGIGTATPQAKLDVNGTTQTKALTITGGADLAEPFKISQPGITKGSVVVIDDENPGQLKLSTQAYDKRVAGIVSGANGIHPGISLHQEGVLDGSENIALSGRVYALADASDGEIQPGDLLTTSPTPGHAMRAADSAKAHGAILGKAMTGLKQGRGLVLVLVTLE